MYRIENFVRKNWDKLRNGGKIQVESHRVEHPTQRPDLFAPPDGAWPVGQTCDYVATLDSGSRLHVQCFEKDGVPMLRFHIDRWDPSVSPGNFIKHALLETPAGPLLGGLAIAGLTVFVASKMRS